MRRYDLNTHTHCPINSSHCSNPTSERRFPSRFIPASAHFEPLVSQIHLRLVRVLRRGSVTIPSCWEHEIYDQPMVKAPNSYPTYHVPRRGLTTNNRRYVFLTCCNSEAPAEKSQRTNSQARRRRRGQRRRRDAKSKGVRRSRESMVKVVESTRKGDLASDEAVDPANILDHDASVT